MKINALIIGSQKSGTTSLLRSFAKHPSVSTHVQPEMTFFSEDWEFNQGFGYVSKKYFPDVADKAYILAKHAHGMYTDGMIERALDHNPDMKFIIILREPVARAISAFNYARQLGAESSTEISDAMFAEESLKGEHPDLGYIRLGEYDNYIAPILAKIGVDKLYVAFLEELQTDWPKTSDEIQMFLGLPKVDLKLIRENEGAAARSIHFARIWYGFNHKNSFKRLVRPFIPVRYRSRLRQTVDQLNTTKNNERIVAPQELVARLREHFAPHNDYLSEILQMQLPPTWCSKSQGLNERRYTDAVIE